MAWSAAVDGTTGNQYLTVQAHATLNWNDYIQNTSALHVELWTRRTNTGYTTSGTFSGGVNIAGGAYGGTTKSVSVTDQWQKLTESDLLIYHNEAGYATVTIGGYGSIAGYGISLSGNIELPRILNVPPQPVSVTPVRNSDTQITVGITHGKVGARNPIYSTQLYRRVVSGTAGDWVEVMNLAGAQTSFVDTGVLPNTAYMYRASTWNDIKQTDFTNSDTIYTTPGAPATATVVKSGSSAVVSWTSGSSYSVDNFKIYDGSTLVGTVSGQTLTWTHTNPTIGVSHTYDVSALKGSLESSKTSSNAVLMLDAPAVPTSVALTRSGNVFTASWSVVTTGIAAASTSTYQFVNTSGTVVSTATISGTSATWTGTTDSAVRVRVLASNAAGSSNYSGYSAYVYNTLATPSIAISSYTAPKTVVVNVTNNSIHSGLFNVERSSNGSTWTVLGNHSLNAGVSKLVTDSDAHTPFSYYRVIATSPAASSYSTVVQQNTITLPSAPTSVSTTWSFSGSTSTIITTWAETSTASAPVDTVTVEVSSDNGSTWVVAGTVSGGVKTYTQTHTLTNQQRRYRVKSTNSAGSSEYAVGNNVATKVAPPASTSNVILSTDGVPTSIQGGFVMGTGIVQPSLSATITLETTGGTVVYTHGTYSEVTNRTTYTFSTPYFNPDTKVLGDLRWRIVYKSTQTGNPSGNIVGDAILTSTVTKVAPVGQETASFTASNTKLTVTGSTPYSCDRTISYRIWPYKSKWTPETESVSLAKAQSGDSYSFTLSGFLQKVPFVVYELTITGKYKDGSTAYTKVLTGSVKKGAVLYLNGDIVRPRVILSDGTIQDVFPKVI